MESEFGRYISSGLFLFIVGSQRKEVTVHSAPLASLSPALDTLINGRMLEAKLRQADWSEVVEEEDTFVRLCEYAYLRDYTPPSCLEREMESSPTPVAASEIEEDVAACEEPPPGASVYLSKKTKGKKKLRKTYKDSSLVRANEANGDRSLVDDECIAATSEPATEPNKDPFDGHRLPYIEKSIWSQHLRDKFKPINMKYSMKHEVASSPRVTQFAPTANSHPGQDFTPVFLGHAKLYVLADKYNILPLADLVLHKLAATLTHFTLCENNVSDVLELVRFSYQHTRPCDAIRKLATTYVVSVLSQIGVKRAFHELLADGGDFVSDFWQMVWGNSWMIWT